MDVVLIRKNIQSGKGFHYLDESRYGGNSL
jgi:hypothetical protein